MVKKANESLRPIVDHRFFKLATTEDTVSIQCPGYKGCTVFSKLDLKRGYYKVPMRPKDVSK
jgi:hypothetical protein